MIGKEILKHKPLPLTEVARMLERREEEAELGFEQNNALEYARVFSHVSPEKAEELMGKLTEIPSVSENIAVKLVDIIPKDPDLIKLIFAQEKRDVSDEEINQILEILNNL